MTEAIDTTTPAGRTMMRMAGAFVKFERAMLSGRTPDDDIALIVVEVV